MELQVRLAAISCVTKDIKEPGDYGGFPAVRIVLLCSLICLLFWCVPWWLCLLYTNCYTVLHILHSSKIGCVKLCNSLCATSITHSVIGWLSMSAKLVGADWLEIWSYNTWICFTFLSVAMQVPIREWRRQVATQFQTSKKRVP